MKGGIIAALAAIAVVLAILALLFAEGSPTVPSASLYTQIQPGTAQSLLVQVQFGYYSIAAPNVVWDLGMHLTYSAVERSNVGAATVLVTNATSAPQIVSVSNLFYTMQSTISIPTVAVCSGISCAGVTENITITAQANVITPYTAWFSPTVVSVFSSASTCVPSGGSACPAVAGNGSPQPSATALNTFLLELVVPMTAILAIGSFVVILLGGKHPALVGLAIGATAAIFVEFLIW